MILVQYKKLDAKNKGSFYPDRCGDATVHDAPRLRDAVRWGRSVAGGR